MPVNCIYNFNLLLLNISNISSANENGSNFSCKWENKNETACIEIIGLVPNSSNFTKSE